MLFLTFLIGQVTVLMSTEGCANKVLSGLAGRSGQDRGLPRGNAPRVIGLPDLLTCGMANLLLFF